MISGTSTIATGELFNLITELDDKKEQVVSLNESIRQLETDNYNLMLEINDINSAIEERDRSIEERDMAIEMHMECIESIRQIVQAAYDRELRLFSHTGLLDPYVYKISEVLNMQLRKVEKDAESATIQS